MIVTEQTVTVTLPKPFTPRSRGIHVSGIIRCIATEMRILKPEWAEELSLVDVREITDQSVVLRILIGLAWEEYYGKFCLPDVSYHTGEMKVDGVYMTHDGESVSVIKTAQGERAVLVCHEFKATYKSTNTVGDLHGQWMWLAQMKAYCKGLNTRFAQMHTLFLCGDYKFPISPQLRSWVLEFTQEEIDGNWDLLTSYKEEKLAMGMKGE